MNSHNATFLIIAVTAYIACSGFLLLDLKRNRHLPALTGLFFMAMGTLLLILDLALISITHGPENIPDYLMFNRLVSDTGFAGRWILTVYVFLGTGVLITIYLLARNLFRKFNRVNNKH